MQKNDKSMFDGLRSTDSVEVGPQGSYLQGVADLPDNMECDSARLSMAQRWGGFKGWSAEEMALQYVQGGCNFTNKEVLCDKPDDKGPEDMMCCPPIFPRL